MKIIVKQNNKKFTLEAALNLELIKIQGACIFPQEGVTLCQSTNLFDLNNDEIYVGDIIIGRDKKRYLVFQYYASVFIKNINEKKSYLIENLTNYKLGNKVDFYLEK